MIHGDDDMHDAEKCRKYQKNKSRGIFFTFFPSSLSLRWQMCCARHFESRIVMTLRSGKWEIKWTSICEFREHDKNVQVLFMIHVTCVWLFQSLSFSFSILSMIWSSLNMILILFLYSPSRTSHFLSYLINLIFSINQKRT